MAPSPETLIVAELFGYEKGAFTGAVGSKSGHLEIADTSKHHRKQQQIATALGMSQPTVARKLQKYGLSSRFGHEER